MNYERKYWKLRNKIEELKETFKNDLMTADQSGESDSNARDRLMVIKMIEGEF